MKNNELIKNEYNNDKDIYNIFIINNATHTYKYVNNAILSLTNIQFEKLSNAESDYWDCDPRTHANGYKRMRYWLNKINITMDDFFAWCAY